MADDVEDRGKVRPCAAYGGAVTKPAWRVSLIEALTMSCAEIDERRLKYEAMSDAEYTDAQFAFNQQNYLHHLYGQAQIGMPMCGQAVSDADDGSAAHEPDPEARFDVLSAICDLLRQENASLRALLSRAEEAGERVATDDPVKADIERTIDHLQHERVSPKLRGDLRRATDQAERVKPGANDAVWKARR